MTSLGQGLHFFPAVHFAVLFGISALRAGKSSSRAARFPGVLRCGAGEGQEPAVPSLCPCAERESGPELPFKLLSSSFHFTLFPTVIALLLCNLLFLLLPIIGFGQPAYGTAPTDFVWLYLSFIYLL